jgi:hypothetical protein
MQDKNSETETQESVTEENNINESVKEGIEPNSTEGKESLSEEGQQAQDQAGELPGDFKGRLAREKKRHERTESQLKGQLTQLQQTVQALLQNNTSQAQPNPPQQVQQDNSGTEIKNKVREAIQEFVTQANQEKVNNEINTRVSDVYRQMETADQIYPDFDDIRNDPTLVFPPQLLQQVALASSNPIDVIYHLSKNRDKLQNVLNSHPALQSGEIARISAELMANAKKGKEATKAPPPANALSTNPVANSGRIRDNATVEELRKVLSF